MNKYDSYKDSGIEWIGDIPSHWEVKKFSSISYMKGRIGWQGLKQAEFTNNSEDPFLITGMNFHHGKIRWDEVYHILEERYNEAPEIQLRESDVLFTKDGTIGKLLFVDSIPYPHKASLNSHLLVLRPLNGSCNPRFLYFQLQGLPFKHHVELTKTGTTFFGITQEAMGQYKALVPPHSEQTAIATYLDRKTAGIDELIADKKRLLELYEEEKTAIINQAVTKGINPDVPMRDSGIEWLGEIPEHWEVKRLKYVISKKLMYGANESAEEDNSANPRYIRITDFGNDGKLKEDTFKSLPHEKANAYLLSDGDILFARSGATVGKTFQFKNYEGAACFAGYLIKATPNPTIMDSDFLYYYTKSGVYENWKSSIFNQATIQNIGADKYAFLEISTPPTIQEQQSIVNHIETECKRIDTQVERTKKLIELLKEYREALISEVVTGKVKVI